MSTPSRSRSRRTIALVACAVVALVAPAVVGLAGVGDRSRASAFTSVSTSGEVVDGASAAAVAEPAVEVGSDVETAPGQFEGDSIDDPALWIHPTAPERSLVLTNDKKGALASYDLSGRLVQRISTPGQFWANVDVRQGVEVGAFRGALVATSSNSTRFFRLDAGTRRMSPVNDTAVSNNLGQGLCLYRSPRTGTLYGIQITIQGLLSQYEIVDPDRDGLLEARVVRRFEVGSEAEGCVADDSTGALYISEEDVALWRYNAEPDGGTRRTAVDVTAARGGQIAADIEGVTLTKGPGAGYVIVSAQRVDMPAKSYFSVYRRSAGNDFVGNFRITQGSTSDDCDRTDGVVASSASLGPRFPRGIFVCQDDQNEAPGAVGNQDLKLTRLGKILRALGEPVR